MTPELKAKCLQILNLVGATVSPTQKELNDENDGTLRGCVEGAGFLHLYTSYHDSSKLHASFSVPADWYRDCYVDPSLRAEVSGNFAITKSAEQIARQLQNRLLADARNRYLAYAVKAKGRDEGRRNRAAALQTVASAVPGATVVFPAQGSNREEASGIRFPWCGTRSWGCQIEPHGNDEVTVKFSGKPELIKQLVALYAAATEGGE